MQLQPEVSGDIVQFVSSVLNICCSHPWIFFVAPPSCIEYTTHIFLLSYQWRYQFWYGIVIAYDYKQNYSFMLGHSFFVFHHYCVKVIFISQWLTRNTKAGFLCPVVCSNHKIKCSAHKSGCIFSATQDACVAETAICFTLFWFSSFICWKWVDVVNTANGTRTSSFSAHFLCHKSPCGWL